MRFAPASRRQPVYPTKNPVRAFADEAVYRVVGAPLIPGNRVNLLKDAGENYPAWLKAIESAKHWIHFESYIVHEDAVGRQFADLLAAKAREGVKVRLIYDWIGGFLNASNRFWRRLASAGVEVRCFNRIRFDLPFGWLTRDHRKMICVDGRVAHVSGLCVGERWMGYPDRRIPPWRDTGVEIEGPAVADVENAFAETWGATGTPLPGEELPDRESLSKAGDVSIRVVGTAPNTALLYRLDQLVASFAKQSIWLSDAYFIGTTAYVQTLRAAALAGVDVRLLVPGASDVPMARSLARSGLRPLLEAGVRVFEWDGSMMHAKTAVVDGRWARVGSTNLNLTSWLGNWELDVIIENEPFARDMEAMYRDDLEQSTEIVLGGKLRTRPIARVKKTSPQPRSQRKGRGSTRRAATGIMRLTNTVSAAITNRRELGPTEIGILLSAALLLIAIAAVGFYWPKSLAFPLVVLAVWIAISLLIRVCKLRFQRDD